MTNMQESTGRLDVGTQGGFGHCFRGSAPLSEGCAHAVARSPPKAGSPQRFPNPGNS